MFGKFEFYWFFHGLTISEKNINKNSCSLRLSLKRGFGGFDGLGEFDGFDGLGGFDGFSEFGEFDGFSGLDR